MKTRLMINYYSLNAIAILFLVMAFLVALGIIPLVKFDSFPGVSLSNALPVFWAVFFYGFATGAILINLACHFTGLSKRLTAFFIVIASLAMILAISFIGAAIESWLHGISIHITTVLLVCCAVLNLTIAILLIRAIFLFPALK
jgi:hypothetical protein